MMPSGSSTPSHVVSIASESAYNGLIKTPHWAAPGGHANTCPRDLLLVISDEIIDAQRLSAPAILNYVHTER
jgi:hypothetical protein